MSTISPLKGQSTSTREERHAMPAPIPAPKFWFEVPTSPERNAEGRILYEQNMRSRGREPSPAGDKNRIYIRSYRRKTAQHFLLEVLENDKAKRIEVEAKKDEERKKEEERKAKRMITKVLSFISKDSGVEN